MRPVRERPRDENHEAHQRSGRNPGRRAPGSWPPTDRPASQYSAASPPQSARRRGRSPSPRLGRATPAGNSANRSPGDLPAEWLVVDLEGIDSGFEEAEHGLFSSRDHGGSGSRRGCDRETLRKELASRAKRKRDGQGSGAEARRSGLAQSGQVALNPKWGQSWGAPDEGGRGDNARYGTGCSIEIQSSIPPRVAYAQCASAETNSANMPPL